jgi:hypothetical protein
MTTDITGFIRGNCAVKCVPLPGGLVHATDRRSRIGRARDFHPLRAQDHPSGIRAAAADTALRAEQNADTAVATALACVQAHEYPPGRT